MKYLLMTFMVLIVVNFIGMVECKNWKKDEKKWLFALIMSMAGTLIMYIRIETWLRDW